MKLTTGLAAAALTAAAVFTTVPAASAVTATPKTTVGYIDGEFTSMKVKPGSLYFGQGGAPFIKKLKWTYWHAGAAYGEGRLHVQKPCSLPSYECTAYTVRWTGVKLTGERLHDGRPYFSKMAITFYRGGKITRHLTDTKGYWTTGLYWSYFG